jgi:hypothetical protein
MKQYIGITRDHSISMQNIAHLAMKDYNEQIAAIKESAIRYGIDTILSVVSCSIRHGYGNTFNEFDVQLSSIGAVKRMLDYKTTGNNTQLFDSVNMLIDQFERVPDYNSPDVAFSIQVLTDGGDNASKTSGRALGERIKRLQATDKWTISFRVPKGYASQLTRLGIPAGNILEVDYNDERNIETATVLTKNATTALYVGRTKGIRGSSSFYADTSAVSTAQVKAELRNITKKVKVIPVPAAYDGYKIQDFVEEKHGGYILGSAYYELSKREEVQDSKQIIVWDRKSGNYYTGREARDLIGIPHIGTVKLVPAQMPQFEIFIQSMSVNRKLVGGTKIVLFTG